MPNNLFHLPAKMISGAPFLALSLTACERKRPLRGVTIWLVATLAFGCNELPGVPEPSTGLLQISASVSGESIDRDPDGFLVTIDDGVAARLPAAGLAVSNLKFGSHSVKIGDVSPNCSVSGINPRVVDVTVNDNLVTIPFEVMCQPNVGSLRISAATTGEELDPNGYGITLPPSRTFIIPTNGTVTIPDIRVGVLDLSHFSFGPNCDHVGSPVRSIQIAFGTTAEVGFTLRCVATGSLQIETTTSGVDPDLNGYVVNIFPHPNGNGSFRLPASGLTSLAGFTPGKYSLEMSDIANNCNTTGSYSSTATVVSGSATPIAFKVTCTAAQLIAYATANGVNSALRVVKSNATENRLISLVTGSNYDPDWSPDGSRVAFTSHRDGSVDIYGMDADGGNLVRLTNVPFPNYRPAWSPDGTKILFVSERDGNPQIYMMDADGRNAVRITTDVGTDGAPTWSPDGQRIAFQSTRDGTQKIWVANADGSNATPLSGSIGGDGQPAWSPDGKKIAFSRSSTLAFRNIYTMNIDGSGLTQISIDYPDASDPSWSPDGLQLAFSANRCTDDHDYYYYYYYYRTCEEDILLARTDGGVLPSSPVLAAGTNPAWRRR